MAFLLGVFVPQRMVQPALATTSAVVSALRASLTRGKLATRLEDSPMALLQKLVTFVPEEKRDQAMAAAGGAALLTGQKLTAVFMFGRGVYGLEQQWRARHPEFRGGFKERWAASTSFYEQTHVDPTNRALHMAGIPLIVGGAVGLLAAPRYSPPWFLAAGAFVSGWTLNLVGHSKFEKNAPAFAEDPLSFVAGPVWDAQQLAKVIQKRMARQAAVAA
jgi:hypothetical protein